MMDVDAGGGDRMALAVLAQYRMATTEQMHLILSPGVRIEQTRRRLAKLRTEGLIDRITLPQAGRTRGSPPSTGYRSLASGRSCGDVGRRKRCRTGPP
ncbi:replication-relaxation family protein [Streptomyces sp. NPDC001698]|uniref:replication-relaxation family protein n=1 Tax=unclassified Streptomyces TaxID=2593676 RepID=UPI0035E242CA